MTVERRTVRRKITEGEFKRLKGFEPFASMRQNAKEVNFAFLFGAYFRTFSVQTLEKSWTDAQVETFIEENKLHDARMSMSEKFPDVSHTTCGYYAVAEFIRDEFFKTYPGLLKRIEDRFNFACDNGYVRSVHGAIRRLPILYWMGSDDNKKEIAGLKNIAANTTIQNDEAVRVGTSMERFERENPIPDNYEFGFVHDSVDFYILKDSLKETVEKYIKPIFERMEPWQNGVPLTIDINVVEFPGGMYHKGKSYQKIMKEKKNV